MSATQIANGHLLQFRFPQDMDDLLFRKPLLHCRPPSSRGLTFYLAHFPGDRPSALVKAGDIDVQYRKGPYGDEAFYNRQQLLAMRHGKRRQKHAEAPLAQADLALITQNVQVLQNQLSDRHSELAQTLKVLSEQLPLLQEQQRGLVEAKNETIREKEKTNDLHKKMGELEERTKRIQPLQKRLKSAREHRSVLEKKLRSAQRYKRGVIILAGGIVGLGIVLIGIQFLTA